MNHNELKKLIKNVLTPWIDIGCVQQKRQFRKHLVILYYDWFPYI